MVRRHNIPVQQKEGYWSMLRSYAALLDHLVQNMNFVLDQLFTRVESGSIVELSSGNCASVLVVRLPYPIWPATKEWIKSLKSLQELEFSYHMSGEISTDLLKSLASLAVSNTLHTLSFTFCALSTSDLIFIYSGNLQALRNLKVHNNRLDFPTNPTLGSLSKQCPQLSAVYLVDLKSIDLTRVGSASFGLQDGKMYVQWSSFWFEDNKDTQQGILIRHQKLFGYSGIICA